MFNVFFFTLYTYHTEIGVHAEFSRCRASA